jgi:uncharacterized protein YqjF (DUF2071 family)
VKRRIDSEWRRGVVFIREIAPRRAVSLVARLIYNENYVTMPMRHHARLAASDSEIREVSYSWRSPRRWNHLGASATEGLAMPAAGSEEEFIAEHYYAYSAQRDGSCLEYKVDHRPWQSWRVTEAVFNCDVASVYGDQFVECLSQPPSSAILLDGSAVAVRRGVLVNATA